LFVGKHREDFCDCGCVTFAEKFLGQFLRAESELMDPDRPPEVFLEGQVEK
jgi:hypothetical protein